MPHVRKVENNSTRIRMPQFHFFQNQIAIPMLTTVAVLWSKGNFQLQFRNFAGLVSPAIYPAIIPVALYVLEIWPKVSPVREVADIKRD